MGGSSRRDSLGGWSTQLEIRVSLWRLRGQLKVQNKKGILSEGDSPKNQKQNPEEAGG